MKLNYLVGVLIFSNAMAMKNHQKIDTNKIIEVKNNSGPAIESYEARISDSPNLFCHRLLGGPASHQRPFCILGNPISRVYGRQEGEIDGTYFFILKEIYENNAKK